jgi:hypothetical protein
MKSIMKTRISLALGAMFVTLTLVGPAAAQKLLPFHGSIQGEETAAFNADQSIRTVAGRGTGRSTLPHLRRFRVGQVDSLAPPGASPWIVWLTCRQTPTLSAPAPSPPPVRSTGPLRLGGQRTEDVKHPRGETMPRKGVRNRFSQHRGARVGATPPHRSRLWRDRTGRLAARQELEKHHCKGTRLCRRDGSHSFPV